MPYSVELGCEAQDAMGARGVEAQVASLEATVE